MLPHSTILTLMLALPALLVQASPMPMSLASRDGNVFPAVAGQANSGQVYDNTRGGLLDDMVDLISISSDRGDGILHRHDDSNVSVSITFPSKQRY